MRAVAIHQRTLNLIIFHSYDPIDIQKGGAEFIGHKIVILSNLCSVLYITLLLLTM